MTKEPIRGTGGGITFQPLYARQVLECTEALGETKFSLPKVVDSYALRATKVSGGFASEDG